MQMTQDMILKQSLPVSTAPAPAPTPPKQQYQITNNRGADKWKEQNMFVQPRLTPIVGPLSSVHSTVSPHEFPLYCE